MQNEVICSFLIHTFNHHKNIHGKDEHQLHDNGFSREERGGGGKGVPGGFNCSCNV